MPADAGPAVIRLQDHRHRVPAKNVLDCGFEFQVARVVWLCAKWNGVFVRRVHRRVGQHDTAAGQLVLQSRQQLLDLVGTSVIQHGLQGLKPFALLDFPFVVLALSRFFHGYLKGSENPCAAVWGGLRATSIEVFLAYPNDRGSS